MSDKRDELLLAGSRLANVAFNLCQREHLTVNERLSLKEAQEAWDALASPPEQPDEAAGLNHDNH